MRFHYIIKSEGTLALFSGTIMLSKGEREPPRHGPWCVNNALLGGMEAGRGSVRSCGEWDHGGV